MTAPYDLSSDVKITQSWLSIHKLELEKEGDFKMPLTIETKICGENKK